MTIYEELEKIRTDNGGLLDPHAVVAEAQSDESALHEYFEWDNTKAGHAYRIWQARKLISCVVIETIGNNERVTAYVSLKEDRGNGGYRSITDILSDDELKAKMLNQALDDLEHWRSKYQAIKKLSPIFKAYDKVRKHG